MSQIKGKNTRPEILVRKFLFSKGFRYRIHDKKLPGKPDIVLKKLNTIVDVRGCFWHKHKNCKYGEELISESEHIMNRVASAVERDIRNEKKWKELGWNVIVVWDSCELEVKRKASEKREKVLSKLLNKLKEIGHTSN